MRIVGIDPGLRNMGWGVVDVDGSRTVYVACGTVRTCTAMPMAERLKHLHDGLHAVLGEHLPAEASVEETFVNKDPQSALRLGQARGVALLVPALHGIPVFEYSASKIKQSVTGTGGAEKEQVQMMVKILLPRAPKALSPDAADALAIAITHSHMRRRG